MGTSHRIPSLIPPQTFAVEIFFAVLAVNFDKKHPLASFLDVQLPAKILSEPSAAVTRLEIRLRAENNFS